MPDAGLFGQVETSYDRHRERVAARQADESRSGRDIGPIPAALHPDRLESCRLDLRRFCETYFPETFRLAWSADHLRLLQWVQEAVLEGELVAAAMPRGSGKTSILSEVSPLWATLYGHRRYPVVIGPESAHAEQIIASISIQLEANDRLAEDFPAACYPIRRLERIPQRAAGQLSEGRPTRLKLTSRKIILPTVPGAASSGAVIEAVGITGRIRGLKHTLADGESIRPDLALIDDPQTEESARSPAQIEAREATIDNAVMGLAGPDVAIAGLAAVTVIEPDDLADRLLDPAKHPEWRAVRAKALYAFPDRIDLWDRYAELYVAGLPTGDVSAATAFYAEHRAEMDAGAVVAWPERHKPGELSGLEHCMRLHLTRPRYFAAEYQNEPIREGQDEETAIIKADELAAKLSGVPRGMVPDDAETLVAMADVQGRALFWLVAAFSQNFTGYVVDYGTEPDQGRPYFTLREIKRTLRRAAPGAGEEGAITAGLERLAGRILGRPWPRQAGGEVYVARMLVDANWKTDTVHAWARSSEHAARVLPSRGRYYGASSKPITDRKAARGDRMGPGWFIAAPGGKRATREVFFDANFWKTFGHARLITPRGDKGSVCLPGSGADARAHRMLAEHLTAEERTRVTAATGRTVDEWRIIRGRDNHLGDCYTGCLVAASIEGAALLEGERREGERKRRKVSLREAQRRRREVAS